MPVIVLWLPAIAIAAHLLEEFVWPGGFARWYREYPPGHVTDVSSRFLIIINAVFIALALVPPLLGATRAGFAYWVVVAAIAAANGLFHIWATLRTRGYSPGVVTGVLLYLPLAVVGLEQLTQRQLVSGPTALQALVIAALYSLWSNWRHRRHARKL
jgi:hypothetical protein